MMQYMLDIYTWPAMRGCECRTRISTHSCPEDAVKHLESQIEPYAYATLQRGDQGSFSPCDWDGSPLENFSVRYGTNGENPVYLAVVKDWDNLIELVLKKRKVNKSKGLIYLASEILQERHPEVTLSEKLAFAACDRLQGKDTIPLKCWQ